ncbi:MAG: serine/threonine protein kinase [Candidatus Obscuribacterales bacterium]|nr:serine/threonine protein kinase [Candidatus Obscuribacterales bacterium]
MEEQTYRKASRHFVPILEVTSESHKMHEPDADEELTLDLNQFPIDRFKPLKLLGTGATGSVYKCFDRQILRPVVLKVLRQLSNKGYVAFQKEVKISSKLSHPCVVQVLDFNVTRSGVPFMVTEFFDGVSLSDFLKANGPLPPTVAIEVLLDIASLLQCTYEQDIYHRDLKPGNILIAFKDEQPRIKVIDFGLASVIPVEQTKTLDGKDVTIAGTPPYMSPERFNLGTYSIESEIYALGCILFEVLSGRPAFLADSSIDCMVKHQTEPPPTLTTECPGLRLGASFDAVIGRCLSKLPRHRYHSPSEFHKALQDIAAAYSGSDQRLTDQMLLSSRNSSSRKKANPAFWISLFFVTLLVGLCIRQGVDFEVRKMIDETPIVQQHPSVNESSVIEDTPESMPTLEPKFEAVGPAAGPEVWNATGAVTDESLKMLSAKKFDGLILGNKEISGEGFKYIRNSGIQRIFLRATNVTDESMLELAKVPTLKSIWIDYTNISDRGVENLMTLRSLRQLNLCGAPITNRSLEVLARNKRLNRIIIGHCKLSKEAIAKFKADNPKCEVQYKPKT